MASPNWMPDGTHGLPSQTSVSSPTIGESPKGLFAAAGIAPPVNVVEETKAANVSVQEQEKFVSPGSGTIRPSVLPVVHPGSSNFPSSLQPPSPGHSASGSLFSYNISHAGVSNNRQLLSQVGTNSLPSAPFPLPASHPAYMPPVTSLQVSPGVPRAHSALAAPGVAPATPSVLNMTTTYISADSSSLTRPVMAAASPLLNPSVYQQGYATYPSVPPVASQGPWLQPPSVGGIVRPPFSPYHAAYVNPYPMAANGMPLPSPVWPSTQPYGFNPLRAAGNTPIFPTGSTDHETGQQPLLPPGIDNIKHANNDDNKNRPVSGQLEAWTAHRAESGSVYYYNALTGESTYEKPAWFKGEPDNVAAQPTPVSWEKLASTDWVWVTTNDGKKYYYNTKTKLSSWQIPEEVTDLQAKKDIETLNELSTPVTGLSVSPEKTSSPVYLNTPAVNTGGRDSVSYKPSPVGSSSALDLIKRKLQDSGAPSTTSPSHPSTEAVALEANGLGVIESTVKGSENESSKDKVKDANPDGGLSDTSDSEEEDSGPTKEECIIQFKVMLKERGVAPFSKWEKELPKIIFDPRFKVIPSHSARRTLFDHYVRTRAEEERKEKRAAQRAAVEGFKQLLEEAKEDIDHNTNYQAFKTKWGHDPRFEALERKERESLLNERVLPLRRAAEEKLRAARSAAVSTFKSMLQERGDITFKSQWSKVKNSLRDDLRYKSVKHEEREALFNEYISELKDGEKKIQQIDTSKLDGEEKLKERERVLRKRKERDEQEVERVRLKTLRKEAIESYQALLVETIKDPQASWTESKSKLERDPQGRAAHPHLDQSDLEKLFREHVKILHERSIQEFRALLAEIITADAALRETEDGKTVFTSWSTAKKLLKVDNRYTKVPRKDREFLWRRHVDDIQRRQKLVNNENTERQSDGKRSSADSNRYLSGSRRTEDRR